MEAYHDNIFPKIREIEEKNKLKATIDCTLALNGGDIAEVENIEGTKNVVNLARRICTCRSLRNEKPPMTKNELRKMIKEMNEYMRLRKDELKASKMEANKTAPKRTRSVHVASA
ncbi:hypothetical protein ACLB2K_058593 [Fragaria x ananassa]